MSHKPDGYTIFCDDIRQEVGNKHSLMGIYGHEMLVHNPFPLTMRMGLYIVFREDPSAPLGDLTLCIYSPGDPQDKPSYKAEIARSAENIPPPPPDLDQAARRTFVLNIVSAINLTEAGKVKVRMIVEGEEIKLGTLTVKQAEPQPA